MNTELLNLIKNRHSVRKWTDKPVLQEFINEIIACGLSAPSSHDSKPWELIVVDQKEIIKDLVSDRLQMKEPPFYINSEKWARTIGIEKYEEVSTPNILILLAGDPEKCPDIPGLIASLGCCGENIMLACHALGLGSVWLYIHDEEMPETEQQVKEKLGVPERILILGMIAIGYPAEEGVGKVHEKITAHIP